MKNGIYLTNLNIYDPQTAEGGVGKKIAAQLQIMRDNDINVELKVVESRKSSLFNSFYVRLPLTSTGAKWKYFNEYEKLDFIYIRYCKIDRGFISLLKKIKRNNRNIKIILEFPTFPIDKESKAKLNGPVVFKRKFWCQHLCKYVDRVLTFSKDRTIYGIPTFITSNGVDCEERTIKEISKQDTINVIAVGYYAYWHGYDRFIEGLGAYYNNVPTREIKFHIVGGGEEISKYKELVQRYGLEKKIIFYGVKTGNELEEIYDKCDIALDAMGRHRSGVGYNSSLKGKEYLAKGLPVVSGVKTELDFDKSFEYYLRVPADDTAIDIGEIIKFYDRIYQDKSEEAIKHIHEEIHEYCVAKYSHQVVWREVIEYIKSF